MAYPEGTPPYGAKILTDHIKVCKAHPLRKAESDIKKLRSALVGLIGATKKKDLVEMRSVLILSNVKPHKRETALVAIQALVETEKD